MIHRVLIVLYVLFLSLEGTSQQKPLFGLPETFGDGGEASFQEIQQLIVENYYYHGISNEDLYWAAIEGMLRHISPPENPELAQLWTDEEYDRILNSLKGIRVTLGFNSSFNSPDGTLTVTGFLKDSKADQILQVQDKIVRIDGQSLKNRTLSEVNTLLDGEVGQSSKLKVIRDIEIFDVELVRDTLKEENVMVSIIPNSSQALIEIKKIAVGVASDLERSIVDLRSQNINSIILDLRNNSGGVLNEGIRIAELFMKKGDIIVRTQSRTNGVTNYAAPVDKYHDLNLAVLINENTASASEIITSALKDHQRCVIIGKKSYGKGVIETTYTLKNDYRVKFITSSMYSPKGISWQGTGLLPDYYVDQSPEAYATVARMEIGQRVNNDLHVSTAIKLLND